MGHTKHSNYHSDWSSERRRSKSGPLYQIYSSFFVFVQAECEGGKTHFSYIEPRAGGLGKDWVTKTESARGPGTAFRPTAGNAVFWFNLHANSTGDDRTLHARLPVQRGMKLEMNIWSRILWNDEHWKPVVFATSAITCRSLGRLTYKKGWCPSVAS